MSKEIPKLLIPKAPKEDLGCVVSIITDGHGSILMGKRRDNGKWTVCAGHIEPNESPEEAAKREIYEETGLTATYLNPIVFPQKAKLYFFSTNCLGTPHTGNDPDKEVSKWQWVDCREGIPANIWNKLAGPEDDSNIVRQLFSQQMGLHKSEKVWLDAGFMELQKANKLLNHPDPRERKFALKVSATPEDLSTAILDPDHIVWHKAFEHPHAQHALDVLSHSTRDSSGQPLFDRHDHLLQDPRCTGKHIINMEQALRHDRHLDPKVLVRRLQTLRKHPLYPGPLYKSNELWHHEYLARNGEVFRPSPVHFENESDAQPDLLDHYNKHINTATPLQPEDADLHTTGRASPKLVYKTPGHKFIVKPYFENENQMAGWNELTSQHLYNQIGIGHLHQKSFIASHGLGYNTIPVVSIKTEPTLSIHQIEKDDLLKKNPLAEQQAQQIGIMDFLTGNGDRHDHNLLVKDGGIPLGIDHANAFHYESMPGAYSDIRDFNPTKMNGTDFHRYSGGGTTHLTESTWHPTGKAKYYNTIRTWWPTVADKAHQAFQERLELVKDPVIKEHLQTGFNVRHNWLNNVAKNGPEHLDEQLKKALDGAGFLHSQHAAIKHPMAQGAGTGGVHGKLMMAHPPGIQSSVDHFENNINKHQNLIKPLHSSESQRGISPKAHYEHEGKGYIVKPAIEPYSKLAGWGELTSQAIYHAAGIGHLHQKSHAFVGNTLENKDNQPPHGIAIHMEPGAMTMMDAMGGHKGTDPSKFKETKPSEGKDPGRAHLTMTDPKHQQSLKQIGLMDYLLSNPDRHGNNLLIKPDGQPVAIDNALSFFNDRKHAYGHEHGWELVGDTKNTIDNMRQDRNHQKTLWNGFENRIGKYEGLSDNENALYQDATVLGGHPDHDTYKWFDQNKQNILNKFQEHVNMLPGREARQKMLNSFMVRFNNLERMSDDKRNNRVIPQANPAKDPTVLEGYNTIKDNTIKDQ